MEAGLKCLSSSSSPLVVIIVEVNVDNSCCNKLISHIWDK